MPESMTPLIILGVVGALFILLLFLPRSLFLQLSN